VKFVVIAVLLVAAACGNSGPAAPKVIPTSSTTAEQARAIDGPVMRYQETSSPSSFLATLVNGELQLEDNCLYLVVKSLDQRFPIVWPAETKWDATNQAVTTPDGVVLHMGDKVQGRGGYFFLSDVNLLAGPAASNAALQCSDRFQFAVMKNEPNAIGLQG